MAVPGKYDDEPTREIDRDYYKLWREAKGAEKAWKEEAERLRALLEDQIGDTFAGTIDGVKVVTYRPGAGLATAAIRRDYPDLVRRFLRQEITEVLDVEAFSRAHPDVAERYRIRSFREVPAVDND